MKNSINLDQMCDPAFRREVEEQSGQTVADCYQCGNCTAGCPAAFMFDRQVSQIMRDVQLGLKNAVLGSKSLNYCLSCSMCSLRCPNEIDVAGIMETLRHMSRHKGKVGVPDVEKFWLSFLDTVRAFGRTYEIGVMALYMLRSLRFTTDLDLAPEALKKHKLPFKPHMVPDHGAAEVRRIMERYRKRAKKEGERP